MKCNTLRLAVLAVCLVSLSALARPSWADPVVTFGWDHTDGDISPRPNADAAFNQFLASLASYGIEPVDGIDTPIELFPGSGIHAAFDPTLVFRTGPAGTGSPTGITATTSGMFATDGTPFQNFAIGTKSISETDGLDPSQPVDSVFQLSEPVTAFGLYVMGGGDALLNTLTVQLSNTITSYSVDVPAINLGPASGDHNIFFLGVSNAIPFNKVTFLESNDFDGMTYDNIVAGNIPEPGSFVLLSLGGACACLVRRTRRGRG